MRELYVKKGGNITRLLIKNNVDAINYAKKKMLADDIEVSSKEEFEAQEKLKLKEKNLIFEKKIETQNKAKKQAAAKLKKAANLTDEEIYFLFNISL